MKRMVALSLCVALLTLSAGALAIGSTPMSLTDTYENAFFYLDASSMLNVEMLVQAEKCFAECAESYYKYSNNYLILTRAMICTANGDYDSALLNINTLVESSQPSFIEDLLAKYVTTISSLDNLKLYIDGRKHEAEGDYAQAVLLYGQCKILDVSMRVLNIRELHPSPVQTTQTNAEGNTTSPPDEYMSLSEVDIEYTLPELTHYTIHEDKLLNVYTGPGIDYNRINKASAWLSRSIWVFAQCEDWLMIQYPIKSEDRIGYINTKGIRFKYSVPILPNADIHALTASACLMFNNPRNENSVMAQLPDNTGVQVLCKYQGYAYVETVISDMPTRGFIYIGDLILAKE